MLKVGFEIVPFDKVRKNSNILVGSRYREFKSISKFEIAKFQDIATITRGVNYKKNQQSTFRTSNIILPADNINLSGELRIEKEIFVDNTVTLSDDKKLKKGDIFICMSSGSKEHIGKVAYINEDTNYYAGGFMGIIRTNPQYCLSKFLYFYLLTSKKFREEIKLLTQGANINNISSTINLVEIPLPSIEIQKQIVDELDGYMEIIKGANKIIRNYIPKLPEYKESTRTLLNDVELFEIVGGGTPDTKNQDYWNGDISWITLADLPQEQYITVINDSERKVTKLGLDHSNAKVLPVGAIVVSTRATIGRVGITKTPLATNQGFKSIIVKNTDMVLPEFLALLLREKTAEMEFLASGATFKEISKSNFEKIEVALPSVDEQKRILLKIHEEQSLVEPAKKLIEVFQSKIETVINKVWGE